MAKRSANARDSATTRRSTMGMRNKAGLIGSARIIAITPRTTRVGMNLKNDMTVADSGSTNRGNDELRINLPPLVIDLAPIVSEFVTR